MQGGRTLTAVQRPKQLKSRMRIGGATTQLEYGFDDHAFSQSDMPTQVRSYASCQQCCLSHVSLYVALLHVDGADGWLLLCVVVLLLDSGS